MRAVSPLSFRRPALALASGLPRAGDRFQVLQRIYSPAPTPRSGDRRSGRSAGVGLTRPARRSARHGCRSRAWHHRRPECRGCAYGRRHRLPGRRPGDPGSAASTSPGPGNRPLPAPVGAQKEVNAAHARQRSRRTGEHPTQVLTVLRKIRSCPGRPTELVKAMTVLIQSGWDQVGKSSHCCKTSSTHGVASAATHARLAVVIRARFAQAWGDFWSAVRARARPRQERAAGAQLHAVDQAAVDGDLGAASGEPRPRSGTQQGMTASSTAIAWCLCPTPPSPHDQLLRQSEPHQLVHNRNGRSRIVRERPLRRSMRPIKQSS